MHETQQTPNSLPDMVDTLNVKTRVPNDPRDKVLVCLDAKIATEENLHKIKEKRLQLLVRQPQKAHRL